MELAQVLHMKGGEGETSYATNSTLQRHVMSLSTPAIQEAVRKCLNKKPLTSIGISDLGCSSGPNTLILISNIIDIVQARSSQMDIAVPELQVSLNDLPGNDFNNIFRSLPEFYKGIKKDKGIDKCFVSCVAGSFYGRLFPTNTLHLVHTSMSLHWLSQTSEALEKKTAAGKKYLNKGKIWISKTSPTGVAKAYLAQFQSDFTAFLRSRAEEMVSGGQMVLSFIGRVSPDPSDEMWSYKWELLGQALMTMASQGLVEEEKIDGFNLPYYAASADEVKGVIQNEGSFIIDQLKECEVVWDEGCNDGRLNDESGTLMSKGQRLAKMIRAAVEPMLESSFGRDIMDELFRIFAELVDDHFLRTNLKFNNFIVSLARRMS